MASASLDQVGTPASVPYRRGGKGICAVCNELSSGARCPRCRAALCDEHADGHAFCEVCPTVVLSRWRALLVRAKRSRGTWLTLAAALAAAGSAALLW
ncbi:MAG: hypothetical protein KC503_43380 [Myxococcales bacterium]|nr:hypothetical protein [Myxococcales bacterium]